MAPKARYTHPISVVETPQMRSRVIAIAQTEGISQTQVFRDLHEMAIDQREAQSAQLMERREQYEDLTKPEPLSSSPSSAK